MSFGYSVSDVFSLGQLAWNTIQKSRKACGEHNELTGEVSALHTVLLRLEQEVKKAESPINTPGDTCREELQLIVSKCGNVLHVLDKILAKYNALSEKERSGRKLWQRVRFGNGEMADLGDLRNKVILYTSAISFYLNMVSMGTVGRIEQQMNHAGGVLKQIQLAVNDITTQFISRNSYEGSVFTTYADDDKGVWREFRRELRHEGFSSSTIHKHKHLILDYIKELGGRGLLDDYEPHDEDWRDLHASSSLGLDVGISEDSVCIPHEVPAAPSPNIEDHPIQFQLESSLEAGLLNSAEITWVESDVEADVPESPQERADDTADLKGDEQALEALTILDSSIKENDENCDDKTDSDMREKRKKSEKLGSYRETGHEDEKEDRATNGRNDINDANSQRLAVVAHIGRRDDSQSLTARTQKRNEGSKGENSNHDKKQVRFEDGKRFSTKRTSGATTKRHRKVESSGTGFIIIAAFLSYGAYLAVERRIRTPSHSR